MDKYDHIYTLADVLRQEFDDLHADDPRREVTRENRLPEAKKDTEQQPVADPSLSKSPELTTVEKVQASYASANKTHTSHDGDGQPLPSGPPDRTLSQDADTDSDAKALGEIWEDVHNLAGDGRTALCLSGGGVRSAAFNLGVLQGLARLGLLQRFHYLSTVSGGAISDAGS